MNALIEQISTMGKTFVGFAWPMLLQSSVLIAILLLADFLLRRKVRAVFRYWLWMLVVIKLVLPTSLSSPMSIGRFMDQPMAAINITENNKPVAGDISDAGYQSAITDGTVDARFDLPPAMPIQGRSIAPTTPIAWQGGVLLVWLAVVVAMLLLLLQRVFFVCGLVRQSSEANDVMKDTLRFCSRKMGVKKTIGLKVSPNATSPAVCGLFRPVILLPNGLDSNLGSDQLKVVLMHELAHIKRGDLWVNLLQTLLQIAYFYNPLLWLANWVIRRVREQAVDEMVQVALGEKAQQYPETLLNVARLAFERPALSLRLVGVVESKSALAGRIKRMLTKPIPKTAKLGIIGSLAIILFAAVLLPMAKGMSDKPKGPIAAGQIIKDETGKITYRVNDKIALEILGITKWPVTKESVWWSADGTVLNKSPLGYSEFEPLDKMSFDKDRKDLNYYIVASRSDKPKEEATVLFHAKSATGQSVGVPATNTFVPAMSMKQECVYVVAASRETVKTGGVVLTALVAGDQWRNVEKIFVGDGAGATSRYSSNDVNGTRNFVGSNAGTTSGGMTYTMTDAGLDKTQITLNSTEELSKYHEATRMDSRVVAVDKKGVVHLQYGGGVGVSTNSLFTQQMGFDLPRNEIDYLELQHRPFAIYEFRNVSFEPGVKTDVQVVVEDKQAKAENAQPVISAADFGDSNGAGEENRMSKPAQTGPPMVVKTVPVTYANDVSPDLDKLTVTFNQRMADKSWSWVPRDAPYPETTGSPYYDNAKRTCTLPVKLEPGKAYLVAFNIEPYLGFRNVAGAPAKSYVLVFATKDKDGKPTPIPEELLAKAKSVNDVATEPAKQEDKAGPIPYTQVTYDEIRPDGTIVFKHTVREINKSGKEIATKNFINSDFVQVTAMTDSDGRELKFKSIHDGDVYRYEVIFNKPIAPGGLIEYTNEGTMAGLVKPVSGSKDTFQYYMKHYPAAGRPTQRIETYLLPAGAELISTIPADMERRTKEGRIELHVEKIIPPGGSITTSFRYRMPER